MGVPLMLGGGSAGGHGVTGHYGPPALAAAPPWGGRGAVGCRPLSVGDRGGWLWDPPAGTSPCGDSGETGRGRAGTGVRLGGKFT